MDLQRPLLLVAIACSTLLAGPSAAARATEQAPGPPVAVSVEQTATWTIQPMAASLQAGETRHFQAFVPALYTGVVTWTTTGGTITPDGLYSAPAAAGSYLVEAAIVGSALRARALITVVAPQGSGTDAADRFVDSVGVNIHLHYNNTVYWQRFDVVKQRLLELGVRHVRDGLIDTDWQPYYDRHNELGKAGIKGVFIIAANTSDEVLRAYPARLPSAFEAYEAPNEYNQSGDADWPTTLRQALARLYSIKNSPALAGFPIFGPALTRESAYLTLGDVSAAIDAGNMHNYFAGRAPGTGGWGNNGYGSIPWNLNLVRTQAARKPIVSTETGYVTDPSDPEWIPEDVVGKYMPRLLLEQFRRGISRTYIYELADEEARKQQLGLLTKDGEPKAAFRAVAGLLRLLSDPGPSFVPAPLRYTVAGGKADLRQMAFQKRNGTYYLALWVEDSAYDVISHRSATVSPEAVTLTLLDPLRVVTTYRWQADGGVLATPPQGSADTFTVTDSLLVLELRP